MKPSALPAIILALSLSQVAAAETKPPAVAASEAETEVDVSSNSDEAANVALASSLSDFCFFPDTPASEYKYKVLKKLKVGKGTYGGVKDILPKLADHARKTGADAIINYTGSQRFGFFPWRMVRPVVRGMGIKWADAKKPDCGAAGGTTLKDILASDTPPAPK